MEGGRGVAYGAEASGGVDGEEGDLVDLGAEDGELGGGGEVEAAVAGRELGGAGEEGAAAGEGEPEGEAVPALDPRVRARVVHRVVVPTASEARAASARASSSGADAAMAARFAGVSADGGGGAEVVYQL
jgi:hypothetical protein